MDKNNRVVIAWVGGGISGINGNENFAIKIHLKNEKVITIDSIEINNKEIL